MAKSKNHTTHNQCKPGSPPRAAGPMRGWGGGAEAARGRAPHRGPHWRL